MSPQAYIALDRERKILRCSGEWTLSGIQKLPLQFSALMNSLPNEIVLDAAAITQMDTVGAVRLKELIFAADRSGKKVAFAGLSHEHQLIYDLVSKNIQKVQSEKIAFPVKPSPLALLGGWSIEKYHNFIYFLIFLGEIIVHFGKYAGMGWKTYGAGG